MQKRYGIIILLITLRISVSSAQNGLQLTPPSITVGTGGLSFYGDVGTKELNPLSNFRMGYHASISERFRNDASASLSLMAGKLSASNSPSKNHLNFESSILSVDLKFLYHFNNDYLLKRSSQVAPYLGFGVGFLSFTTNGDLKDASGNPYNYWSDGSIRNLDQYDVTAIKAVKVKRDFVYETQLSVLKQDSIDYGTSSITFPLTGGFTFNLSPSVSLDLNTTYYFTRTDWIDDVSRQSKGVRRGDKPMDHFVYTAVGLTYTFGASKEEEQNKGRFENVDFEAIDKADVDKDGIPDTKDKCSGTAPNSKVDQYGCPFDDDGDGVPNELDRELKTAKGALVDEHGVTLSKKKVMEKIVAGERITPKAETAPVVSDGSMPQEHKWADQNNDGKISQREISLAIDKFFDDGSGAITPASVMKLIDYFFDQ